MPRVAWTSAVGLFLVVALSAPATAQEYKVGAGLNLTEAPGITGQHAFAALLIPTPASSLAGRFEGFLQTTDAYGTSIAVTANLQFAPLQERLVRPYLLAGGGMQFGRSAAIAVNGGVGVEFRTLGRSVFVELTLRSFGTRTWQDGSFAFSVGTGF